MTDGYTDLHGNEAEKPAWATPPGGGETREASQTEMFAREDGGRE